MPVDDAKIMEGVWSNKESNMLVKDLHRMKQCSDKWFVKANRRKCKAMQTGTGLNRLDCDDHNGNKCYKDEAVKDFLEVTSRRAYHRS